jgi:hypothetical protein
LSFSLEDVQNWVLFSNYLFIFNISTSKLS